MANFDHSIEAAEQKIRDLVLHRHLAQWHPISTAPCNQNLELSIIESGRLTVLPFPCRRSNDGKWINVDLGIPVRIEPVRWRVWQNTAQPASPNLAGAKDKADTDVAANSRREPE